MIILVESVRVFSSPYSKHQSSVVCVINGLCFDISKYSMNDIFESYLHHQGEILICFCIFFNF